MKYKWITLLLTGIFISSATLAEQPPVKEKEGKMKKAVFAAGCFWGVESLFQQVNGVIDTTVGYTGGAKKSPTYKEVCGGKTGHAEAVEVIFDPTVVSYEKLLELFWRLHDPTTANRQGPDVGTQYRSAVFYFDEQQKNAAEKVKETSQKKWKKPIVTEFAKATTFYPAEDYHQDYFKKHGHSGCHFLRD